MPLGWLPQEVRVAAAVQLQANFGFYNDETFYFLTQPWVCTVVWDADPPSWISTVVATTPPPIPICHKYDSCCPISGVKEIVDFRQTLSFLDSILQRSTAASHVTYRSMKCTSHIYTLSALSSLFFGLLTVIVKHYYLFALFSPSGFQQSSHLHGKDSFVALSRSRQEGCAHRICPAHQRHSC